MRTSTLAPHLPRPKLHPPHFPSATHPSMPRHIILVQTPHTHTPHPLRKRHTRTRPPLPIKHITRIRRPMLLRGRTTLIRKGSDPAAVPEAARGVLLVAGVELVFVAQGPGGCAVVAVDFVDVPVFAVLVYGADVVAGVQFCDWLGLWREGGSVGFGAYIPSTP